MYLSNKIEDYKKIGLQEILGPDASADFPRIKEVSPGDAFIHGILIRAGRAGFHYWLMQEGDSLEKANPDFRLSPIKTKIHTGLQHLCRSLSTEKKYKIEFTDHDNRWELAMIASGRLGISPHECSFLSGFVQEFASWAGMGKLYQVRGKGCEYYPAQCSIFIEKEPVE